ncbi:type II toxin-antitoxin system prevent-host-death family antitoxin [bacterium]|jgi:prevent-host-death family protein|nr:type II toxin-antitoxin system prevent-host-death family antitoxin [bacterium]
MKTITTHDAKTHLSRYLAEVEKGVQITIARGKKPVAMLVPVNSPKNSRRPKVGNIKGSRYEFLDSAFSALNKEQLKEWGL